MKWNPHLSFNGQCEAAFKFYEQCLGGRINLMMTYGGSPLAGETAPGWDKKIAHATFSLDDQVLTGADVASDQKPRGFSILLNIGEVEEAERVFKTLAENGEVQMPLQETFWALRFGMFTDQFGTPWMINCGKGT